MRWRGSALPNTGQEVERIRRVLFSTGQRVCTHDSLRSMDRVTCVF